MLRKLSYITFILALIGILLCPTSYATQDTVHFEVNVTLETGTIDLTGIDLAEILPEIGIIEIEIPKFNAQAILNLDIPFTLISNQQDQDAGPPDIVTVSLSRGKMSGTLQLRLLDGNGNILADSVPVPLPEMDSPLGISETQLPGPTLSISNIDVGIAPVLVTNSTVQAKLSPSGSVQPSIYSITWTGEGAKELRINFSDAHSHGKLNLSNLQYISEIKLKIQPVIAGFKASIFETELAELPVKGSPSTIVIGDWNAVPKADFGFEPSEPVAGEEIEFLDNSRDADGTIISREWAFGDGETSREQSPRHKYASPGGYIVTLTVQDNLGATHSHEITIQVMGAAVPPPTGIPYEYFIAGLIIMLIIGLVVGYFIGKRSERGI